MAILTIIILDYMAWSGRLQIDNALFSIGGILLVFDTNSIVDKIISAVS